MNNYKNRWEKLKVARIERRIKAMKAWTLSDEEFNFYFGIVSYRFEYEKYVLRRDSDIRKNYSDGLSITDLSYHFGLSRQGIYDILKGFYKGLDK